MNYCSNAAWMLAFDQAVEPSYPVGYPSNPSRFLEAALRFSVGAWPTVYHVALSFAPHSSGPTWRRNPLFAFEQKPMAWVAGVTQPFKGTMTAPGFPGFDPVDPSALLRLALGGMNVTRTTVLHVDTATQSAGINNIPFIKRQADAQRMVSTFWSHEFDELDAAGNPRMVLQYLQDVSLDFLPSPKGGLIRWPHISINTLHKVVL